MMKSVILIFCLAISLYGQIKFYTTETTVVGSGIIHMKIIAPTVPWTLNVLEIDLEDPYLRIETVKGNDRLGYREIVSSISERNDYSLHEVVGSINGDFWDGTNNPVGAQIATGQIVKMPNYWSAIGFNIDLDPFIEIVSFSGRLSKNNKTLTINTVNATRGTNQTVLYNSFFGGNTGTNQYGTEMLVTPIDDWVMNTTVRCLVDSIGIGIGNMVIPKGKAVLSGHGTSATFLSNEISKNDTLTLLLSLNPGLPQLYQLVSGFPKIIKDGQNYALQGYAEEGGSSDFATARHPRTAAGFSADSTKLFLVVVDGRQEISSGMNLVELADFMIDLGAYRAINLDGGGSSSMVVRGEIENSPSDGIERAVTNALLAVSKAPRGDLYAIQIIPDHIRIFEGDQIKINTSGWDINYHPYDLSAEQLIYSVDNSVGSVSSGGYFNAAAKSDSGFLYVQYNNLVDSAYVRIKTARNISIEPKFAVTDTLNTITYRMSAVDEDGLRAPLSNLDYHWQSLNQEIGTIDSSGVFKGLKQGVVRIVASYNQLSDTAEVSVQQGSGEVVVDSLDEIGNWKISGVLYDIDKTFISISDTPRVVGSGAFRLDYSFVRNAQGRTFIALNNNLNVFGLPDTILVDIKSDGQRHWLNIVISDDNEELFRASAGEYADNPNVYQTLKVPLDNFYAVNPPAVFNYPIRIETIEVRMGYYTAVGDTNVGKIYFDNLRVKYPEKISNLNKQEYFLPADILLHQNYPNPFNSKTRIEFELPQGGQVTITVYDIQGRKVEELVNNVVSQGRHVVHWLANNLASGIYFYRLEAVNFISTRKMLLIQ